MRLQVTHHLGKIDASRLLGGLDVDEFLLDEQLILIGVGVQQLLLGRDGEALLLLLLR
nr:hypothetical protein [Rhodovulum sp. PH10]